MTLAMNLEKTKLFENPSKITRFAIAVSIVAHITAVVLVNIVHFADAPVIAAQPENYVDLGYEEFTDVPVVVDANTPITKSEEIPDKADPTPAVAQEMQDQASDVGGLQKEVTKDVKKVAVSGNVTNVPYYKVKPKYPKEALLSGVEGHIELTIDVEQDGSVDNIRVTGGEKVSIFESEARRAVAKWKYKPFTDDAGTAVKKTDYLVRVDFKLADEATASN